MQYVVQSPPEFVGQWLPTLPGHVPLDYRWRYMVIAQLPPDRWWHLAYRYRADDEGEEGFEEVFAIHRAWIISDRFDGDMRLHGETDQGDPRNFHERGITMVGNTTRDRPWASLEIWIAAEFPDILRAMDDWRFSVESGEVEKRSPWPPPPYD